MPICTVIQPSLELSTDFIDYPYFCGLGAYQALAQLERRGWQVQLVDGFDQPASDLRRYGDRFWLGEPRDAFLGRVQGASADPDLVLVCASPFLMSRQTQGWLFDLLTAAGSGSSSLVLADMFQGGMHYLEYDGQALLARNPSLDLVMRYEGEQLLDRLASDLEHNRKPDREVWEQRDPGSLDGWQGPAIEYLSVENFFVFLERVLSSPLRPGPFPPQPARSLPLAISRGCPFGCVFCTRNPGQPGSGTGTRVVPWNRVQALVNEWIVRWKLERLVVLDEIPNLETKRFERLLALAESHGLALSFPNGLRADRIDEEHVQRLAKLTSELKVSMESASPRVQREVLDKNLDPASVERVARWCHNAGLPLQVHFLVGLPGEHPEEILATLNAAIDLHARYQIEPLVQFATPMPGTELDRICREQGLLVEDPADLHSCFQKQSLIETADFNPVFLNRAMAGFRQTLKPPAARKVIVNLTYRCNNRCRFCAVGGRPERDAELDQVLATLKKHRNSGSTLLDLDGGEPTLHEGLLAIIQTARRLDYERITLTTNGRRLSYQPYARKIARSGLDEILVSLHGPNPQVQDGLTRSPGSFDQTLAGLRNILAEIDDPSKVAVNTTVTVLNLDHLPALGKLVAGIGVKRWNLQVLTPFGRATADQQPEPPDLGKALSALFAEPPPGLRIGLVNCAPCLMPEYQELAAGDFAKIEREMVFVGEAGINLQEYLAERRGRVDGCEKCAWSLACPGLYHFDPEGKPLR